MRIHLIHGFNVIDGGNNSIDKLLPYFALRGHEVINHDYGWVGLLRLRWRNRKATKMILPSIQDGDVIIGHSNGCLICWELLEAGAKPGAVVCIQPALRRDAKWPAGIKVLCLHNAKDWAVSLGRMWGRFISVVNPFSRAHGWGAAGRYGFDSSDNGVITNWDTGVPPVPALGHSGIFDTNALYHWGLKIEKWCQPFDKDTLI